MTEEATTSRRALLAAFLLCALVFAQSVSLITQHSHHHASQHVCYVCHAGALPFLGPAEVAPLNPALTIARVEGATPPAAPDENSPRSTSPRAPPAAVQAA